VLFIRALKGMASRIFFVKFQKLLAECPTSAFQTTQTQTATLTTFFLADAVHAALLALHATHGAALA
jgi:hypothetical protein